jgi:hypothetical protein
MRYILSKDDRKYYIGICNRWVNNDLTLEYIKKTIRDFAWATSVFIPEMGGCDVVSQVDILIDDILGIDSISEVEKNEEVLELVEMHKQEIQTLAKRVIEQIKADIKEFKEEADTRGYCQELTKRA